MVCNSSAAGSMQSERCAAACLAKVRNVDGETADELTIERIEAILQRREAAAPWALGTTSIALARELGTGEAVLVRWLAQPPVAARIRNQAGWYATAEFVVRATPEQEEFFEALLHGTATGLEPVPFAEVVQAVRRSKIAGATAAFDTRLALGELVRVGAYLYRGVQLATIQARLETVLRAEQRLSAARFRDLVGTSRKYAIPLLEYFDRLGVTVRDGDDRRLP
jgi:selenocysteine-specific elongation factor